MARPRRKTPPTPGPSPQAVLVTGETQVSQEEALAQLQQWQARQDQALDLAHFNLTATGASLVDMLRRAEKAEARVLALVLERDQAIAERDAALARVAELEPLADDGLPYEHWPEELP